MKQLKDAFDHRHVGPPRSVRDLARRFDHAPRGSVAALLRKAGPFQVPRDAYRFTNKGWPITEEDARALREHYQRLVEPISVIGIGLVRAALAGFSISSPLGPVSLPAVAIDFVINKVTGDLRNQLLDKIIARIPGEYGRCGGMAFSAFDFFLAGWPIDPSPEQPAEGDLRKYIWNRLLDSLEQNAGTFLEWVMVLHVLPVISRLASAAIGTAAGAVIGGLPGAAIGGFVAGKEDVLGLGGTGPILEKSREHWKRLRATLDREAAWPIGLVYGGDALPIGQHQVLAIGYGDQGDNRGFLLVWDNNDVSTQPPRRMDLDFRSGQLFVNCDKPELNDVKGIICEEYTFHLPPASLRR